MNERNDVVEHAMAYPYPRLSHPFVQLGHRTLDPAEVEIDRDERLPVLAYGSNAAPEALGRKLALSHDPVLVVPARLHDFDVVYSAHISPYGAVPATLQRSPGTAAHVHLAYLTSEQLTLISATEPNYEKVELAATCQPEDGEPLTELSAYLSRHGCLLLDGVEVALAAVDASARAFAELSQSQVLERVRAALSPAESIDEFVLTNVTDPTRSEARSSQLPRRAPVLS